MSPRKFVIPALLVGSGLLSGYTQSPNGHHLVYHGTPLVTHPYDLSTGKPTITEFSTTMPGFLPALPTDLKSKVSYSLPEGRDIRLNAQGLVPDSDDKTNIRMAKDGEVWVTFVSEGAGYRNSVGYFIYDPPSRPNRPPRCKRRSSSPMRRCRRPWMPPAPPSRTRSRWVSSLRARRWAS